MLKAIQNFFNHNLDLASKASPGSGQLRKVELAAAALMVELMQADTVLDQRESEQFLQVLSETFALDKKTLDDLIALARQEAQSATSLYQFTRLINDNYTYAEKVSLIQNLWRLAFADEHLNKYEEHLIRNIADLIHVSHSDFIRSKLQEKPV